jgi:ATP-dependent exoDNAse (exonuclease V) beta subunit
MFGGLRKGSGLEDKALTEAEGQTASQLQLQEGLRVLYVGFTRARDKLVLAHRAGPCGWLSLVPDVDRLANPDLPDGEHAMEGADTTCVVKRLAPEMAEEFRRAPPTSQTWLAPLDRAGDPAKSVERYHLPSGVRLTDTATVVTETLGEGRFTLPHLDLESRAQFGEAVHGFFATWPSTTGLEAAQREAVAARCLRGFGAEALLPARDLTEMGARFHRWVEHKYPGATWRTEVPVTAPRREGGQWDGIADLLLYVADDEVVVVDHKSSPVDDGRYEAKAATYGGQLAAYREALAAQGMKVRGMWIHFPLAGVVAHVKG